MPDPTQPRAASPAPPGARRDVIIDTDPGLDDALAILAALAAPGLRVLGLTTVAGNIGLEMTTHNAGRLLALAGRADIPVVAGAAGPLARRGFDVADIHGEGGLGGVALPAPLAAPMADAPGWIAARLMAAPAGRIDLLTLGPLTNVALLLRHAPQAARRLRRIVAMGGAVATHGNIGPVSEFNLAADPEAADAVLRSGVPIVLVPLDVTRQVRADAGWTAALAASGGAGGRAAAALVGAYLDPASGRLSRPLHDPCVTLLALYPDLFRVERRQLTLDLSPDAGTPGGGEGWRSAVADPGALRLASSGAVAGGGGAMAAAAAVDVALGVDAPAALAELGKLLRAL